MRDLAVKQNSDSYLASEYIKRETSVEEAAETREEMQRVVRVYEETGRELYSIRSKNEP